MISKTHELKNYQISFLHEGEGTDLMFKLSPTNVSGKTDWVFFFFH